MSSHYSGNDRQAMGRERENVSRPGYGEGFGQPATESQRLRLFAHAYDEQMRQTGAPATSYGVRELEPHSSSWWVLLGLAVFVLLLVVAMGLGALLLHPR